MIPNQDTNATSNPALFSLMTNTFLNASITFKLKDQEEKGVKKKKKETCRKCHIQTG